MLRSSRIRCLALVAKAAIALAVAPQVAGASEWRSPVPGPVTRAFLLGPDVFAPGHHRGADLSAPPGTRVRAACSGTVTFAGRVPRGPTVSVRCGRLVATHQHLERLRVRRGDRVRAGAAIGRVGDSGRPRPHVHLGARVAATGRYVDPMALMRSEGLGPAPPPVAAPRGPGIRPRPPARAPVRLPRGWAPPAPVRAPYAAASRGGIAVEPARAPSALPWTAKVGLLLVAPALGVGGLVRLRRSPRQGPAGLREVARAPR